MTRILIALGLALAAAPAWGQAVQTTPPATASDAVPVDYAAAASWLCRPGRADPCGRPLSTTALNANGYGSSGEVRPAEDPPIDCFYVYPTVSRDSGLNSDMNAGPEEMAVAAVQFARFGTVCRTFAPLYRSVSLAAIPRSLAGQDVSANFAIAYDDVRAAWRHYLEHDNHGRPFVLFGHSQGTIHLARLLAEEIENVPAIAGRMLSALLIGYNVEVPEGRPVGGTFRRTPICTQAGQTGCVVTYVSFREASPPPAGALFGRSTRPGFTVACTHPASLAGGTAPLDSYWFTASPPLPGAPTINWSSSGPPPTPFLRTEGLASATCVSDGQAGYLAVKVNADPADARTDAIPGDIYFMGNVVPGWGMHLADVNLAQGDLIRLVEAQGQAFSATRR
ncbi:MAG: DUF3089 domain-containing protein [Allosphingosinicella sp.]